MATPIRPITRDASVVLALREALVYCRVSTRGQEEKGTSLDSQERECVAHAAALGFTVGRITHEVYSGAELWDRPKLSRDRADLKAGRFVALICYATDRLSRDPIHLAILAEECERADVALHFVSETFDDSDESALIRYVKDYSNKKEREKIRERSLRGKHQRAIDGKIHNMGPELYGYRRDKEHGIRLVYEPEAAVVRRIFTLILEGPSYHAVARVLNADLVPAPGAARVAASDPTKRAYWTRNAVMRIVRNPAYKGETVAWRWKRQDGMGKRGNIVRPIERPEEEWIQLPDGVTPALVSPEQWERAQAAAHQQVGDHTRNEKIPYLLRGLVYCGHCGRKLWPSWAHKGNGSTWATAPKYRTYRCSSYSMTTGPCGGRIANAEKLETRVWERIEHVLRHPEVIAADLQRREEEGPDPILTDDLAKARREVARCDREQHKLVAKLRAAEDSTSRMWKLVEEEVDALETDREQWQHTITEIEGRLADQQATTVQLAQLYDTCARWSANLEQFGFDEQRLALEALEVRVTANGKDWAIQGSIPLDVLGDVLSPIP